MKNTLLTVEEVADVLRLKVKTIRKWIYVGRIPFVKLGRSVRISRKTVEDLIRQGTRANP